MPAYRTYKLDPHEIPLERDPFFLARMNHLLEANPAMLSGLIQQGKLLEHLRQSANQAIQLKAKLVSQGVRPPEAEELALASIADPQEMPSDPDEQDEAVREEALKLLRLFNCHLDSVVPTYPTSSEDPE